MIRVRWGHWRKRCGLGSSHLGAIPRQQFQSAYTLPELLVIVVFAGILAAIGAASWTGFWANYSLSIAQGEVYQAIREARETAKRRNLPWQVSFRVSASQTVEWATYAADSDPVQAQWQVLPAGVQLSPQSTLLQSNGIYKVTFSHKGHVNGQLGKVILASRADARKHRCVVVSTLLGGMRRGDDSSQCAPSN